MLTLAPTDTVRREKNAEPPSLERRRKQRLPDPPWIRRSCRPNCPATSHARGCGRRDAWQPGRVRAGGPGVGGGGKDRRRARRASRWERPRARARPVPSPPHVPRARAASSPPGARRLLPSRRVCLGLQSRTLRGAPATAVVLAAASSPAVQHRPSAPRPRPPPSPPPLPFLSAPSLPHGPRREPGYEAGGREKGVGKWRCCAWIMPSTAPPAPAGGDQNLSLRPFSCATEMVRAAGTVRLAGWGGPAARRRGYWSPADPAGPGGRVFCCPPCSVER